MKAVRHLGIVVGDLNKALSFYRELLGLRVVRRMEEAGDYIDKISGLIGVKVTTVKLTCGDGTLIELLNYHSHPRQVPSGKEICGIGASHVAFTVDDLDSQYKRLLEAGVHFNSPPQISPDGYAKVTFCKDPDGTPIELVEEL